MASSRSTFYIVATAVDKDGNKVEFKNLEVHYFGKAAVEAITTNKKIDGSVIASVEPTTAETNE